MRSGAGGARPDVRAAAPAVAGRRAGAERARAPSFEVGEAVSAIVGDSISAARPAAVRRRRGPRGCRRRTSRLVEVGGGGVEELGRVAFQKASTKASAAARVVPGAEGNVARSAAGRARLSRGARPLPVRSRSQHWRSGGDVGGDLAGADQRLGAAWLDVRSAGRRPIAERRRRKSPSRLHRGAIVRGDRRADQGEKRSARRLSASSTRDPVASTAHVRARQGSGAAIDVGSDAAHDKGPGGLSLADHRASRALRRRSSSAIDIVAADSCTLAVPDLRVAQAPLAARQQRRRRRPARSRWPGRSGRRRRRGRCRRARG